MTTNCNQTAQTDMQTDSQTAKAQPGSLHPAGSAMIMHQGYIIELADGGPWLKNDLTWTPVWDDRGVWHELVDAELAIARSLSPNAALSESGAPTRKRDHAN